MGFTENRSAGILWMLATMVCFITLDATMKYSLQSYSLVEVTWARFFFAMLASMIVCGRNILNLLQPQSLKMQLIRSALLMTTTTLFGAGISTVPLSTGTVIMFMSPIMVTFLSNAILGEHVGWRRWSSICVGFVGALIVIRIWETGLSGLNVGVLFLLGAALANASYQIATRSMRHEAPLTTLLYTALVGSVVMSTQLPFHWSTPDLQGWGVLVICGVAGCVGHLCLIKAFQAAPASVVAPFSYSALVWATIFGFAIWRDVPTLTTMLGAALIIGSGFYIFLRERQLATVVNET
jgi:drug/metabolite transporter (DMT)-like permease